MAYGYNGIGYNSPSYYNGYNVGAVQYQQPQGANFSLNSPNPVVMPMQQPSNGIIWVQGEEGAKAYMVAPGNSVQLWDSENPVIYLKSADANGIPSMRIFDLVERVTSARMPLESPNSSNDKFVTQDQIDVLQTKINALERQIQSLNDLSEQPKTAKGKPKGEIDNG